MKELFFNTCMLSLKVAEICFTVHRMLKFFFNFQNFVQSFLKMFSMSAHNFLSKYFPGNSKFPHKSTNSSHVLHPLRS